MLDFNSLLLASGLSGACLAATMFAIWFVDASARFVGLMAAGIVILVLHITAFWHYSQVPSTWLCQLVLVLLSGGFLTVYCAARQHLGLRNYRRAVLPTAAAAAVVAAVTYAGFDGLGFILAYATVTVLLIFSAAAFWGHRDRDRRIMTVVAALAAVSGISFALCGLVLAVNGQWVLGSAPDNWAEQLNSFISVACMTVLGAVTLSLHHIETQTALRTESMTDPLTSLMNRRGLAALYGDREIGPHMAVAIFDLDHFKKTNDVFGHPVGDEVLQRFALVVGKYSRTGVDAFRLGGEEFALVMSRVTEEKAYDIASKISTAFGTEIVRTALGPLRSTVSGGIGIGRSGSSLDTVLAEADVALYHAKQAGRNRVVSPKSMNLPAGAAAPALRVA